MLSADLTTQLNSIVQHQSNYFDIGVYVTDAATGKVLYNYNGTHLMTPASNTKVLTSAATYLYLGPNGTFTTSLNGATPVVGGVLQGNLYVKFTGDPTLTSADIAAMANILKIQGITRIAGNVVLDETAFSGPYYALGWSQDDLSYCYAAPIAASIINSNCMGLQVTKKPRAKTPVVRQYNTNFPVVDQLRLVSRRELRTCVFQPTITSNNTILLQGCLPNRRQWSFAFAVKNPVNYAHQVVQTALTRAGIQVTGQFVTGKMPGTASALVLHHSMTLQAIMSHMLKVSDNVYAGALTKTLGNDYYGVGSYKAGANAIGAILAAHVPGFKAPTLEDGSGESAYNLIAPQQLVQVLNYMYAQPVLGPIFMRSLAISGQKGTLSYRMTQNGLVGHVFGKTGTIHGVSTLSGYLALPGAPVTTFAIMMNGIQGSPNHARYIQNQMVQVIANNIR